MVSKAGGAGVLVLTSIEGNHQQCTTHQRCKAAAPLINGAAVQGRRTTHQRCKAATPPINGARPPHHSSTVQGRRTTHTFPILISRSPLWSPVLEVSPINVKEVLPYLSTCIIIIMTTTTSIIMIIIIIYTCKCMQTVVMLQKITQLCTAEKKPWYIYRNGSGAIYDHCCCCT